MIPVAYTVFVTSGEYIFGYFISDNLQWRIIGLFKDLLYYLISINR